MTTRSIPVLSIVLVGMLSFLIFGCAEEEEDDLVKIPDVQLHSDIKWELNIRDDTSITVEDMLKLTELDAEYSSYRIFDPLFGTHDRPISNLTGLEYAENLVVLNLNENNIRNISPLEGLENLRELNLSSNHVRDLTPLAGLENLRVLDFGGNGHYATPLDITPLAGLRNLRELNLGGSGHYATPLDITPLAGLRNLRELNLGFNNIVDISPLMGLKNLQKLDLTDNPLSDNSKNLIIPIIEANGTEVLY